MSDTLAGFTFFPLQATERGQILDYKQRDTFLTASYAPEVATIFVMSHGWKTGGGSARNGLYGPLLENMRTQLGAASKSSIALGVFWPSSPYYDAAGAVPGGIALGVADARKTALLQSLDRLEATIFDTNDAEAGDQQPTAEQQLRLQHLKEARAQVDELKGDTAVQDSFVGSLMRTLTAAPGGRIDTDGVAEMSGLPGHEILAELAERRPVSNRTVRSRSTAANSLRLPGASSALGAQGGSTLGVGVADVVNGARWLVEQLSFWEMKERAGRVGAAALNHTLSEARKARPDLRIHLIGHSFGARLVTAAVDGPVPIKAQSLSLLQAAFSHHALTENFKDQEDGYFYKVIRDGKVSGPIVVTHTKNDTALRDYYRKGTSLRRDNRLSVDDKGGAGDQYGALGSNGAVGLPSKHVKQLDILDVGKSYELKSQAVNNVRSDKYIKHPTDPQGDAHGYVTGPQVAHLILSATRA